MGGAFLITLREGLEISLIVAIVLAYLRRTGRRELFRPVWGGTAAAMAVCAVAGALFYVLVGELAGKVEQVVEGVLAVSAAGVLTWMIFWMRRQARGLSGALQAKVDEAASRSHRALAALAFVAVAREGFETALFLLGAKVETTSGAPVVVGGVLGLVISAFLGFLVYQGGHRIDIKRFFMVTGALLILFAAGLFAKGLHELVVEALGVGGLLGGHVWRVTSGPFSHGWLSDFFQGMFGWAPEESSRIRVVGYFVYLLPVTALYFAGARPIRASTSSTASSAESARAKASTG